MYVKPPKSRAVHPSEACSFPVTSYLLFYITDPNVPIQQYLTMACKTEQELNISPQEEKKTQCGSVSDEVSRETFLIPVCRFQILPTTYFFLREFELEFSLFQKRILSTTWLGDQRVTRQVHRLYPAGKKLQCGH